MAILAEMLPMLTCEITLDMNAVQLLVQCQNVCMVARRLHLLEFVKSPTKIGFMINPYNPTVANKTPGSSQITCFHVDDCK